MAPSRREKIIAIAAEAIAPLAWKALGLCDTLTQKSRRTASVRHAEAALLALERAGFKMAEREPTAAMIVAAFSVDCEKEEFCPRYRVAWDALPTIAADEERER